MEVAEAELLIEIRDGALQAHGDFDPLRVEAQPWPV